MGDDGWIGYAVGISTGTGTAMNYPLSIILPAKNEAANLPPLLAQLIALLPAAEILVVDDGSTDATARVCRDQGVWVVRHPYSLGNGAAIKTGARHATGDVLVFMDADGQHDPADIPRLLAKLDEGYESFPSCRCRFLSNSGSQKRLSLIFSQARRSRLTARRFSCSN
jgi:glycosyltransferase involved in cell wall biosynthesis